MSRTLQDEIAGWSQEAFGSGILQVSLKLSQEHDELQDAVARGWTEFSTSAVAGDVAKESADVLFMLFQLADAFEFDLLEETRKKFEVNKRRSWVKQPDGTYQHT